MQFLKEYWIGILIALAVLAALYFAFDGGFVSGVIGADAPGSGGGSIN